MYLYIQMKLQEWNLTCSFYRVARQCCPGGNRPETPRRPSAGGLRIFWAKSLVITAIYTNLSLIFVYMARITRDLTQKIRRPPAEGLRGGLRTISAGTTLPGHTVYCKIPPQMTHGKLSGSAQNRSCAVLCRAATIACTM